MLGRSGTAWSLFARHQLSTAPFSTGEMRTARQFIKTYFVKKKHQLTTQWQGGDDWRSSGSQKLAIALVWESRLGFSHSDQDPGVEEG